MTPHQLSLFDQMSNDEDSPLPLLVAKRWGFNLRSTVVEGKHWYSVIDWVSGLTGSSVPKRAWQKIRNAPEMKTALELVRLIKFPDTKFPAQAIDDRGLYHIAANMHAAKTRKALTEIKEFLATAGAFADLMRRDPNARAQLAVTAGPEAVFAATVNRYETMGRSDNWISVRLEGVVTRKEFTSALRRAVLDASKAIFGKSTEKLYSGLWQRTTQELRQELEITSKRESLRDKFGEYALIYTRLAEKVASDKLKDAEFVHEALAMEIVYDAAKLIRRQAMATSEELGIDLVTEKPLLQAKKRGGGVTQQVFTRALKKVSRPSNTGDAF